MQHISTCVKERTQPDVYKLRKATIGLVMSVRSSAWNSLPPSGRIFMTFDIQGFFENMSREFKFDLNPTRRVGNLRQNLST
jgi:hypothetical protein